LLHIQLGHFPFFYRDYHLQEDKQWEEIQQQEDQKQQQEDQKQQQGHEEDQWEVEHKEGEWFCRSFLLLHHLRQAHASWSNALSA
jgi:hypothetical protein